MPIPKYFKYQYAKEFLSDRDEVPERQVSHARKKSHDDSN